MNKNLFNSEMTKCKTLYRYGPPEKKDFWDGYRRGLRRRFHGDKFDTEEAHQQWLGLVNDDYHRDKGLGYRAGFYGPVRLTTDNPNSSYGIPVFVNENGGSMDYVDGFVALREWWGIKGLADTAGVSERTAEGWCSGRPPGTKSLLRIYSLYINPSI